MDAYTTAEHAARTLATHIDGKIVLITGASLGGLGAEMARVIAPYASLVILAGRSREKLEDTKRSISTEAPKANIRLLLIDLASWDSVRQAAAEVNSYAEPIDVLINNAGILMPQTFQTIKGTNIELQFGTNHLGPFLFTNLIKPRLAASAFPKIINISSFGHKICRILDDVTFDNGRRYSPSEGYGQSKTANILFAVSLAEKWKDIGTISASVHPGVVMGTNIWGNMRVVDYIMLMLKYLLSATLQMVWGGGSRDTFTWKSLQQGAATGSYYVDCAVHDDMAAPYALDRVEAQRLWKLSEALVGQKFD